MLRNSRRDGVRQFATVVFAAALVSVAAGFTPRPGRSSAPGRVAPATRTADLAGVYVLTRASGVKPPIAFAMSLAGGTFAGTVDGARVILASDGTYTNAVVVTWTKAPLFPIPGIAADGRPHTLVGAGGYTLNGGTIVLTPADLFSRSVVGAVQATSAGSGLDLVSASGGLAGTSISLDAHFVRVR